MRILLFTGYLEKKLNANTKIACEVARTLAQNGHEVTVCGLSYIENTTYIDNAGVKWVYYNCSDFISRAKGKLENYVNSTSTSRTVATKRFAMRHPLLALAIHHSYTSNDSRTVVRRSCAVLEDLHQHEKCDAVLAFQMPFWAEEAVISSNLDDCKKCIYQLDPWGLHETLNIGMKTPEQRRKEELANFEKADCIFTTPVLIHQYRNHTEYSRFLEKIIAVDFPNLRFTESTLPSPIRYDSKHINILFAGVVNDDFRNPEVFLRSVEKLIKEGMNIQVHFLGTNSSKTLGEFASKYPGNVFSHSPVTAEEAFAALSECDFLLNISNSISNMVPSKIFDYFSLGKPLINIQRIKNCPAEPYVSKYPLCFNIREFDMPEDCAEQLEMFLIANKGARIDFETIKEIYHTATPEYVAGQIESVLSKSNTGEI